MPGRTPYDAVRSFLAPLERAASVLKTTAKLTIGPNNGFRLGAEFSWSINNFTGARLRFRGHEQGIFTASMRFEVIATSQEIRDAGAGDYRVTTRGYNYSLTRNDETVWRIHWHPTGRSPVKGPHIHTLPDLSLHRPVGRMTFEDAIRWCILDGAELRYSVQKTEQVLDGCEKPHLEHRTWDTGSPLIVEQ